ncbi:peptidase T-like protein [Gracilibacillus halophilus YIM-C55.5]|uniref:Peptidase T-like protein n=1 Tax=Gracilibacillus halophilus YIM-C55.5 TaxID=1308866 RepID=N4WDS5_9BACI|nr:peptidase T-like protein [Gracilibacillus halophilus YIM-C55.5]
MNLGRIDEETTANIGSFEGKGPTNIVCDQVMLSAEARSLSRDKLDRQVEHMTTVLDHVANQMGGETNIRTVSMYPSYRFDENDPVVHTAMKAVQQLGRSVHLVQSGGGSDANHFSNKGVPTVNLGIGYEHIHTTDERISLDELNKIPNLIVEIIKQANVS